MLRDTVQSTTRITAMVMFILICAQVFSLAFRGLHGEKLVQDAFTLLPGGINASIWFLMALIFVLGFFIEWIEISYIAVPLFLPIFINANTDLVWLSTMICVNLQTSFLTPPFGWSLFFLRGVAPPEVTTRDIYRGIVPFVGHAGDGAGAGVRVSRAGDLAAEGDRLVIAFGAGGLFGRYFIFMPGMACMPRHRLRAARLGADAFDGEVDVDFAGLGELQRGLEMLALHELLLQAHEHDVIAARIEGDGLPRLDLEATSAPCAFSSRRLPSSSHGPRSCLRDVRGAADQAVGRGSGIGDRHIAAADAGAFRRGARPGRGDFQARRR